MIDNRIASIDFLLSRTMTLGTGLLCVAVGLLATGCGGAPVDSAGEEEGIGQTEQALDGVINSLQVYDGRVDVGLNNLYNYTNPYYNIKWGVLGSPLTTATNYGGLFSVNGLSAGAPYTFSARACDGYAWGWGNTCSAWTTPTTAFLPYAGSSWGYSANYPVDGLATAWGAGYFPNNGANVKLPLCSALGNGGQYLGYWYDGGCSIGYGGALHTYPTAQVLLNVPGNAVWNSYSHGFLPHGALKGGYVDGNALYACQTSYQGAYVPGWTAGDGCNIGWGGGYYNAPASASKILCL